MQGQSAFRYHLALRVPSDQLTNPAPDTVRFHDEATQVFIVRCTRDFYRSLWASMTLMDAVCGKPMSVSVLKVSSK